MYQELSTESFIDEVFVECFMPQNLCTAGPHDMLVRILSVHTVKQNVIKVSTNCSSLNFNCFSNEVDKSLWTWEIREYRLLRIVPIITPSTGTFKNRESQQ